jgi:hypothetical protein
VRHERGEGEGEGLPVLSPTLSSAVNMQSEHRLALTLSLPGETNGFAALENFLHASLLPMRQRILPLPSGEESGFAARENFLRA